MKLADYLHEHGVRQVDFAAKIGVAQSMVSRLAAGSHKPSFELLDKIHEATGGLVSFDDFRATAPVAA